MIAVPRMRPAPMQATIVVPSVVTTTMPVRVPMAMTVAAPDLEQAGSSLEMFGGERGRVCRAGGCKSKCRNGGPGDCTYFHWSSFELIAPDNGMEPVWFPPALEG